MITPLTEAAKELLAIFEENEGHLLTTKFLTSQMDIDSRRLQTLKTELLKAGHFIGSTAHKGEAGYIYCDNEREYKEMIREHERKAKSTLAHLYAPFKARGIAVQLDLQL